MQLRRVGVRKLSQLKRNCREFEQYMVVDYDYEILKKRPNPQAKSLRSRIN